jgi:hypothetical protein
METFTIGLGSRWWVRVFDRSPLVPSSINGDMPNGTAKSARSMTTTAGGIINHDAKRAHGAGP